MKRLNTQRFILGIVSTLALVATVVGIFVALGMKIQMDAVAVGLLTLLIRELGGGKATAFAWFFDGSADKPPPSLGTSTTVASSVSPTEPNALAGATPAGTPGDPVAVTEVTKP